MKSIQYAIYKGVGGKFAAVQFNMQPPHFYCLACKRKNYFGTDHPTGTDCVGEMNQREGAVFVEIAKTTAPNIYDWSTKIIMALSITDMGKLLHGLRSGNEVKLMHDPGAKSASAGQITKGLTVTPSEKGALFSVRETSKAGEGKNYTVPMSPDEVTVLGTLLSVAIPRCLAWT